MYAFIKTLISIDLKIDAGIKILLLAYYSKMFF